MSIFTTEPFKIWNDEPLEYFKSLTDRIDAALKNKGRTSIVICDTRENFAFLNNVNLEVPTVVLNKLFKMFLLDYLDHYLNSEGDDRYMTPETLSTVVKESINNLNDQLVAENEQENTIPLTLIKNNVSSIEFLVEHLVIEAPVFIETILDTFRDVKAIKSVSERTWFDNDVAFITYAAKGRPELSIQKKNITFKQF